MPNPSTIENSEVLETSPGSEVTAETTIDQPADAVPESASASSVTSPVGGEAGNGESAVFSMAADSPALSSSPAEVVVVEVAPVEAVPEVTPVAAVAESTEVTSVAPEAIPETPASTSPVAPPEASEPVVVIGGGGGFEVPAVAVPLEFRSLTMLERIEALELKVAALEAGSV